MPKTMRSFLLAASAALMVSACATTPAPETADGISDPYEGFNRNMLALNTEVDRYAIGPAANAYKTVTPKFARDRVSDFTRNLGEPVTFVNDVLQGNPARASDTFFRFTLNSTFGLLGLWDPAEQVGVERHSEDFGQTLAVWGVDSGPYLVLPLMGPSNPRDTFGRVIDRAFQPLTWVEFAGEPDLAENIDLGSSILGGLNARVALDAQFEALQSQPEPYVALRRIYSSQRQADINNGVVDEQEAYDDLPDFDEFGE